jgi:hypothetical protein
VSPNGTLWPDQIHPDDRPKALAGLNAAVAGTAQAWSDEYRVRRKDGTYAVVADRAYIERDGEGRAIRVIGALADITQRKQAEEHYRQKDRLDAVGRLAGQHRQQLAEKDPPGAVVGLARGARQRPRALALGEQGDARRRGLHVPAGCHRR